GADDHAGVGPHRVGEVRDRGGRDGAGHHDPASHRADAGAEGRLDHVPGQARVLADDDSGVLSGSLARDVGDGAAEAQRQLGGHGRHVGAPAHAVGSKELTLIHESGLRWLARSEPAGCAARGATSGAGLEGGSCGRASTGQSRKLTNCRSRSSFSAPRSIWITSWRSSRFLPETRTESSWMAAWTLSLASLISLTISLAFSVSMPSFT